MLGNVLIPCTIIMTIEIIMKDALDDQGCHMLLVLINDCMLIFYFSLPLVIATFSLHASTFSLKHIIIILKLHRIILKIKCRKAKEDLLRTVQDRKTCVKKRK